MPREHWHVLTGSAISVLSSWFFYQRWRLLILAWNFASVVIKHSRGEVVKYTRVPYLTFRGFAVDVEGMSLYGLALGDSLLSLRLW